MRRTSKFMCGMGAGAFVCACIALYIFCHIPFPWGSGTLPGGMSDAGAEDPFERAMNYQVRVLAIVIGTGFVGAVYFVLGSLGYVISRFIPTSAKTA